MSFQKIYVKSWLSFLFIEISSFKDYLFLTHEIWKYQIWKALLDQFLKNEDYLDHTL